MSQLSASSTIHDSVASAAESPRRAPRRGIFLFAVLMALAMVAGACGGGATEVSSRTDDEPTADNAEPTPRPTLAAEEPTAVPATDDGASSTSTDDASSTDDADDAPTDPLVVNAIGDVAMATVKISAQGTFVPPLEVSQTSFAGIGTGFIIDPSGLMVTNNHVVTGAPIIEVYFDGSAEPINARLLGVSECSDLALLDLEGDGYSYLEFRSDMDSISPGLPVFAAGYPLNFDTDFLAVDYTLTAGIVSTTQASGESVWASVDGVIEHDARIRGGNSGGPLVDEDARVIGINYAGADVNDLNEAINAQEAAGIIEQLRDGDVESLGINGEAVVLEELSGVWVSGVASGSVADRAGLRPGDLITTMENLPLATDGTLSTYCDIIRTSGPTETLSIEVVRIGTEEVLTGQINGEPLVQSFSFAQELGDQMTDDTGANAAGYESYEFVTDDTGQVGVEVPTEWVDRNGVPAEDFGESIYASPDIDGFLGTWDVPGVIVERNTSLTSADIDSVLDIWADLDCADRSGREDFETNDGVFVGRWEVFTQCGGTDTAALTIAVSPPDGNSVVRMFFQIVTDADLEAADRAIASFDSAS